MEVEAGHVRRETMPSGPESPPRLPSTTERRLPACPIWNTPAPVPSSTPVLPTRHHLIESRLCTVTLQLFLGCTSTSGLPILHALGFLVSLANGTTTCSKQASTSFCRRPRAACQDWSSSLAYRQPLSWLSSTPSVTEIPEWPSLLNTAQAPLEEMVSVGVPSLSFAFTLYRPQRLCPGHTD